MRPVETLLAEALELAEDERARIALRLAESLEPTPTPGAQQAWAQEIARRVQRVLEGSARTVTAEQALSAARARLAARRA